jgi:hypothetical protein
MSKNNPSILHVGLDVARLSLQLHLASRFHSLANDRKGHTQLLKLLRSHPNAHVVCEATGGYEQPVVQVLQAADVPVSIVEAGRVRHFARAQGRRAKTNPIDAAVLTGYGTTFKPVAATPVSPQQQRLADLAQRRRQLIHTRTAEHNRAEHYADPLCVRQARQLQRILEKQIQQCDQALTALIAEELNRTGADVEEVRNSSMELINTLLLQKSMNEDTAVKDLAILGRIVLESQERINPAREKFQFKAAKAALEALPMAEQIKKEDMERERARMEAMRRQIFRKELDKIIE